MIYSTLQNHWHPLNTVKEVIIISVINLLTHLIVLSGTIQNLKDKRTSNSRYQCMKWLSGMHARKQPFLFTFLWKYRYLFFSNLTKRREESEGEALEVTVPGQVH